jgi:hypothetical protein
MLNVRVKYEDRQEKCHLNMLLTASVNRRKFHNSTTELMLLLLRLQ